MTNKKFFNDTKLNSLCVREIVMKEKYVLKNWERKKKRRKGTEKIKKKKRKNNNIKNYRNLTLDISNHYSNKTSIFVENTFVYG